MATTNSSTRNSSKTSTLTAADYRTSKQLASIVTPANADASEWRANYKLCRDKFSQKQRLSAIESFNTKAVEIGDTIRVGEVEFTRAKDVPDYVRDRVASKPSKAAKSSKRSFSTLDLTDSKRAPKHTKRARKTHAQKADVIEQVLKLQRQTLRNTNATIKALQEIL